MGHDWMDGRQPTHTFLPTPPVSVSLLLTAYATGVSTLRSNIHGKYKADKHQTTQTCVYIHVEQQALVNTRACHDRSKQQPKTISPSHTCLHCKLRPLIFVWRLHKPVCVCVVRNKVWLLLCIVDQLLFGLSFCVLHCYANRLLQLSVMDALKTIWQTRSRPLKFVRKSD